MEASADEMMVPAEAGAWDTFPHPWRRYGARTVDVQLFGTMLLFVLAFLSGPFLPESVLGFVLRGGALLEILLFGPLFWMVSAPVIALLLAHFGTTPGKLLFGLRVVPSDGAAPTLSRLLKREWRLLIWGVAFAIPLVSLVATITSFETVNKGEQARWDEETALIVEGRRVAGWQLLGVVVGTVAVVAILFLGVVGRFAGTAGGL